MFQSLLLAVTTMAGVLLPMFPVYACFLFNRVGYAVYLHMLHRMRLPPLVSGTANGKSLLGDYLDGLRYIRSHPLIGMLLVLTFFNDALRLLTHRLLPAFADSLFGTGAGGLAILAGATGVGAAVAWVWLSQQRRPQRMMGIILAASRWRLPRPWCSSPRVTRGRQSGRVCCSGWRRKWP